MKIMSSEALARVSAGLVSLALLAAPAAAEPDHRSTLSGTVKIETSPQDAKAGTEPKRDHTLTIHIVTPQQPAAGDDEEPADKLRRCGEKWNKKLAAYEKSLPKLKKYIAYYDKWARSPAQRPPKSVEPLLTRESYRACIYACLGDTTVTCPGGWPAEKSESSVNNSGEGALP